jgi:hypothetical protein
MRLKTIKLIGQKNRELAAAIVDSENTEMAYLTKEGILDECFRPVTKKMADRIEKWLSRKDPLSLYPIQ